MRRLLVPILGGVLVVAAPATTAATERPPSEVARLAESAAAGDTDALDDLLATTTVDGLPVEIDAALSIGDPDEQATRLQTLIRFLRIDQDTRSDDERIRAAVTDVLSQPKFQTPPESFWDRLFARLSSWLLSLIGNVISLLGGPLIAGVVALGLLASIVALSTARIARRRAARIDARLDLERLISEGADPVDLERVAAEAADRGEYGTAVRARFVAGILRLHTAGRIHYAKGLTTGQIGDQIRSHTFTSLAATFDEIAYGGRPGTRDDHEEALDGWQRILSREPV